MASLPPQVAKCINSPIKHTAMEMNLLPPPEGTKEIKKTKKDEVKIYAAPTTSIEFMSPDRTESVYNWVYIVIGSLALCLVVYFFAGVFFAGIMLLIALAFLGAVGLSGVRLTSAIGDIARNQVANVRITAKNPKELIGMAISHYGGAAIGISMLLITFSTIVAICMFGILSTTQTFIAVLPRLNSTGVVDTAALRREITASVVSKMMQGASSKVHIVHRGETIRGIADTYGTTTGNILALNPAVNPNSIEIGDQILVPLHPQK